MREAGLQNSHRILACRIHDGWRNHRIHGRLALRRHRRAAARQFLGLGTSRSQLARVQVRCGACALGFGGYCGCCRLRRSREALRGRQCRCKSAASTLAGSRLYGRNRPWQCGDIDRDGFKDWIHGTVPANFRRLAYDPCTPVTMSTLSAQNRGKTPRAVNSRESRICRSR